MEDDGPRDVDAGALIPDVAAHRADLGRRPFVFRHALVDDALFARDDLGDLVARLPCAWVLAHEAQHSPLECRGKDPLPPGTDLSAVIRELPTAHASIRAYNLEHTTAFRPLLEEAQVAVRALVGDREGGVADVNLATFLASAAAVTAAHPDRHHNLLLQVTGEKEIWIDDEADRRRHHTRTIDYFRAPHLGAPELPPARSFILSPGDGVYIPPYAWHWTQVLGDHAAGLSIGFSTPSTIRNARVVAVDMKLRRLGMRPRPLDAEATSITSRVKVGVEPVAAAADRVRRGRGDRLVAFHDSQEEAR